MELISRNLKVRSTARRGCVDHLSNPCERGFHYVSLFATQVMVIVWEKPIRVIDVTSGNQRIEITNREIDVDFAITATEKP